MGKAAQEVAAVHVAMEEIIQEDHLEEGVKANHSNAVKSLRFKVQNRRRTQRRDSRLGAVVLGESVNSCTNCFHVMRQKLNEIRGSQGQESTKFCTSIMLRATGLERAPESSWWLRPAVSESDSPWGFRVPAGASCCFALALKS